MNNQKEGLEQLVELIDKNCQSFPDFDYMQAMALCQQLYQESNSKQQIKYMGYGPAAQQLSDENERLKNNNQRLKRSHKNKRKQWRETEDQLRTQINELLNEVEYLEQFRHSLMNKNTFQEYIKK